MSYILYMQGNLPPLDKNFHNLGAVTLWCGQMTDGYLMQGDFKETNMLILWGERQHPLQPIANQLLPCITCLLM